MIYKQKYGWENLHCNQSVDLSSGVDPQSKIIVSSIP